MTCSSCGRLLTDAERFCPSCARPRALPTRRRLRRCHTRSRCRRRRRYRVRAPTGPVPSRRSFDGRFPPGTLLAVAYRIVALARARRHGRGLSRRRPDARSAGRAQVPARRRSPTTPSGSRASAPRCASRGRSRIRTSAASTTSARSTAIPSCRWSTSTARTSRRCCGASDACRTTRRSRWRGSSARGSAAAHEQGRAAPRPEAGQRDDRRPRQGPAHGLRPRRRWRRMPADDALAGTPAYMAPEQFDGSRRRSSPTSTRWGSCCTRCSRGKPAFQSARVGELARLHHESTPTSLSKHRCRTPIPAIERVIQRCLAKEPAERPASALAVAAALPGGDPLAAALAAGETPSPAMVAAAGGVGALQPRRGARVSGGACSRIRDRRGAQRAHPGDSLRPLRASLRRCSPIRRSSIMRPSRVYRAAAAIRRYGFTSTDYITYLEDHDRSVTRWENLRQGSRPDSRSGIARVRGTLTTDRFSCSGYVTLLEPPLRDARDGRRDARPARPAASTDGRGAADSRPRPTGNAAGLDHRCSARPVSIPRGSRRRRRAGRRRCTPTRGPRGTASIPIDPMLRSTSKRRRPAGLPVFFQIFEPWSRTTLLPQRASGAASGAIVGLTSLRRGVLIGAFLLVRRNIRLGRGDREGAFRLGLAAVLRAVAAACARRRPPARSDRHVPVLAPARRLTVCCWGRSPGSPILRSNPISAAVRRTC